MLIIFIQIFMLYDISVFKLISPFVYVFLIINMPFNVSTPVMILYSFAIGYIIDGFYNTGGMHTIPTLLVGFIRPYIFSLVVPQKGFDLGSSISLYSWNIYRSTIFIFLVTFIHHFILFWIEALDSNGLIFVFFRTVFSTAVSMMFMYIFLLFKK